MSDLERDAIVTVVDELESLANVQPEHNTTRSTLFRLAADLRRMVKQSVITKTYRGKPVKG